LKSLYLGAKSVDQEHRLPKQIGRLSVRTVARKKHLDPAVLGQAAWLSDLIINDAGRIMPITLNGDIALRQDTAFAGAIRYDAFRHQIMVTARLPWAQNWCEPRPWDDSDTHKTMYWLQEQGIILNVNQVYGVIETIAKDDIYHPVMDFLGWTTPSAPKWDGNPRLGDGDTPSWLTTYCGVDDSPYVRAVGASWAISAVARLREPRRRRTAVLVLGGRTDVDKSEVFRALASPFYGALSALSVKTAKEEIATGWIVELTDFDALRGIADWRAVISFSERLSDKIPRSRGWPCYQPRQCILGATTERSPWPPEFRSVACLWPVRCHQIDIPALRRDRVQFWAEARTRCGAREIGEIDRIKSIADEQEMDKWDTAVLLNPPARHSPTILWQQYLAALRKMPQDVPVIYSEILRAEQELARRQAALGERQLEGG
jgi:Virulence-associated protein E